jgi:hypothetical protein
MTETKHGLAYRVFCEEVREKAKARPKAAIGKKRPRCLITPSSFKEPTPWWKAAPAVVWVDIVTGRVLVFRWPLQ